MKLKMSLDRFIEIQDCDYQKALNEIKAGKKESHWMWYVFPQLRGIGNSKMADYYGIQNLSEAKEFLQNRILAERLVAACDALLSINHKTALAIFGSPDDLKLHSSMTLFSRATVEISVFKKVIEKFFNGREDYRTIDLLRE